MSEKNSPFSLAKMLGLPSANVEPDSSDPILTNSIASVQHLSNWTSIGDQTSLDILNRTFSNHRVHFQGVPSHVGIDGNEKADFLPRTEAEKGRTDIEESISNVVMSAWPPQVNYPSSNFSRHLSHETLMDTPLEEHKRKVLNWVEVWTLDSCIAAKALYYEQSVLGYRIGKTGSPPRFTVFQHWHANFLL
ncbi:hypothetical protein TNCV_4976061 [Trichonephila clavipes]|uniref:RNase H type-1 domain-containing protein n=1 Tax=Trichonephila clavipes TaxID=2585209 RepID=A0A8X6SH65_TRICX|nr:hypothetical protein TNCV_4976061 [Trichonephila clavipes]